jgi:hypothetical protein
MFGLAKEKELDFLLGVELLQICFGTHQVILKFENDVEVSLECDCQVIPKQLHWLAAYEMPAAANILGLLGQKIVETSNFGDGELAWKFSGGNTLLVRDSNEAAESYQIMSRDQRIIV